VSLPAYLPEMYLLVFVALPSWALASVVRLLFDCCRLISMLFISALSGIAFMLHVLELVQHMLQLMPSTIILLGKFSCSRHK
jgi:hypothetical protein